MPHGRCIIIVHCYEFSVHNFARARNGNYARQSQIDIIQDPERTLFCSAAIHDHNQHDGDIDTTMRKRYHSDLIR